MMVQVMEELLLLHIFLMSYVHAYDQMQKTVNNIDEYGSISTGLKPNSLTAFWDTNCFDLYDTKYCKILKDQWNFCKYSTVNRMDEMCRKTCGLCKQRGDCTLTRFKCCPDGFNPKADIQGSNCKGCHDKEIHLCKKYSQDCNKIGWAGLWMRGNCKKTCQLCKVSKPLCTDDAEQKVFCPSWKKYGLCNIQNSLMKTYCRETCGFCTKNNNKLAA